jgi:hypothetical protein
MGDKKNILKKYLTFHNSGITSNEVSVANEMCEYVQHFRLPSLPFNNNSGIKKMSKNI